MGRFGRLRNGRDFGRVSRLWLTKRGVLIMALVWIVTDEENPDLLEGFATREEGLAFIAQNNGAKDTLCLRSLLIKGV